MLMVFSPAIAQVQVFVTFSSYNGNFPGLAGADAACTTVAIEDAYFKAKLFCNFVITKNGL